MSMITRIAELIREHDDYTVIAHIAPDGDTICSCMALKLGLEQIGKKAQVVCDNRVPPMFAFLEESYFVKTMPDVKRTESCIAVDCADRLRMGTCAKLFDAASFTVCLDHHGTNIGFGDLFCVDTTAAATGEIVYLLFKEMGVDIDSDIARYLYCAIIADSGQFAYSNTTPRTMRIAADLLETGIDGNELHTKLYSSDPVSKLRIKARAINNLQLFADGKIAVTVLTQRDILAAGASNEDTEGIAEMLRGIDTVELSAVIKEQRDGAFKVSMRSQNIGNVAAIARKFGGGGHERAAGYTIARPLTYCLNTLTDELLRELDV